MSFAKSSIKECKAMKNSKSKIVKKWFDTTKSLSITDIKSGLEILWEGYKYQACKT